MSISLSESAARHINKVVTESGEPALCMRLEIVAEGCKGSKFKLEFAPATGDSKEVIVERDGAKLMISPEALEQLDGSTLDYIESNMESRFQILYPETISSCGCGRSFGKKAH